MNSEKKSREEIKKETSKLVKKLEKEYQKSPHTVLTEEEYKKLERLNGDPKLMDDK